MKSILLLVSILVVAPARAEPSGEPPAARGWSMSRLGAVPVHSGGRLKPLDSFARETVLHLTGGRTYLGWAPIETLVSWIAQPDSWSDVAFLSIGRDDVRRQLGLDEGRRRFTARELQQNFSLAQYAERQGSGSQTPNLVGGVNSSGPRDQELSQVLERLGFFRALVGGQAWPVVPRPAPQAWAALVGTEPEGQAIRAGFLQLLKAYTAGDEPGFQTASAAIDEAVRARLDEPARGDLPRLSVELAYNRVRPFLWSWASYLLAGLLGLLGLFAARARGQDPWKAPLGAHPLLRATGVAVALGLAAHVAGMSLRMYVAGRPPVTNMYESIVWVFFGVILFAGVLYAIHRHALILIIAGWVSALGMIAGDAAPAMMDPGLHPLVPVLRSNLWLTIHVLTITLGYSAFALTLGTGNVALWLFARKAPGGVAQSQRIALLNQLTYRAMQFGVILLAAGTILGGVWADYSWGRFWGWDPKEVWALIALLCYVAILHARFTGWIGQFGFAVWSVLAFLSVLMAWYGVNFILGVGLHSYGFSSGGSGFVIGFIAVQGAYIGWATWRHKRGATS